MAGSAVRLPPHNRERHDCRDAGRHQQSAGQQEHANSSIIIFMMDTISAAHDDRLNSVDPAGEFD
jgi:hypothetical protein